MSRFITWKEPWWFGDTVGILASTSARKLLQTREAENRDKQNEEYSGQRKKQKGASFTTSAGVPKSLEKDMKMGWEKWEAKTVYHFSF